MAKRNPKKGVKKPANARALKESGKEIVKPPLCDAESNVPPPTTGVSAVVSNEALEMSVRAQRQAAAAERRRRIQAFDETLVEWRNSRPVIAAAEGRVGAGARGGAGQVPSLRILAEGDSWFDFPLRGDPFRSGDVISRLKDLIPYPILNLAVRGDEARSMLGVEQRRRLREQLMNPKRDFNVLLFSGGGNDIVGDPFRLWIRDRDICAGDPTRAINDAAFGNILGVVRTAYEDLLALRDEAVARTPGRHIGIFLHGYDWAIPTGRKVCGIGPWLKPSLNDRGWTDRDEGAAIVKETLSRFDDLLRDLASRHADVVMVPTQGTLGEGDWGDELHPSRQGFIKIAKRFYEVLKASFPAAVA